MLKIEIIDKYFFHFQPGAHHRVRGKQVCRIIDNIYIYFFYFQQRTFQEATGMSSKRKKKNVLQTD